MVDSSKKKAGGIKAISDKPLVSVVLPVYNKEFVIARTCREISSYLASNGYPFEIIAVDDGSKDNSVEIMRSVLKELDHVLVESDKNRGKGYAVRVGVEKARGDLIAIVDADHAIDIDHLPRFEKALNEGNDIAIGSRFIDGSHFIDPRPYRAILSRSLNVLVRGGLPLKYSDTQCGFKVLSKKAAQMLMPKTVINRFLIDVELLYLAHTHGLKVAEVPVDCVITPRSSIRLVRDPIQMIFDLVELIRKHRLNGDK